VLRRSLPFIAAIAAALAVVSLSAAAHQQARKTHRFPHRIISLSPTVTEDLFAIGAGKQVIAVDQDSNYPRRAPRTSPRTTTRLSGPGSSTISTEAAVKESSGTSTQEH